MSNIQVNLQVYDKLDNIIKFRFYHYLSCNLFEFWLRQLKSELECSKRPEEIMFTRQAAEATPESRLAAPDALIETTFYVRFAETDLMGIVHHSQYVVWMEEGRSDFMRRKGFTFDQWEAANIGFAVSEMNLRYHAPAHYGERVTVRTWIESLRSRQIVFGYQVVNADSQRELVTGTVKLIAVDKQNQVRTIPREVQNTLTR
jgi:acyl-CoA thioester hydrolase